MIPKELPKTQWSWQQVLQWIAPLQVFLLELLLDFRQS
jgi:hypothetical protein